MMPGDVVVFVRNGCPDNDITLGEGPLNLNDVVVVSEVCCYEDWHCQGFRYEGYLKNFIENDIWSCVCCFEPVIKAPLKQKQREKA